MRGHAPDHGRTREAIGSALEVRDQRSNAVRLTGAIRDSEAPQLEHRLAPIAQVRGAVGQPQLTDQVAPVGTQVFCHGVRTRAGNIVSDEK